MYLTSQGVQIVIYVPNHNVSKARQFEKIEINVMPHMDFILPSYSEKASINVFFSKKDCSLHFSIPFIVLIAVNVKNLSAIQQMVWCLNLFVSHANNLDATCHWGKLANPLLMIQTTTKWNKSNNGLYIFQGMISSMRKTPSGFHRVMDSILHTIRGQFGLMYMEVSSTFEISF